MMFYHGSTSLFRSFRIVTRATVTREEYPVPIFVTSEKGFALLHTMNGGYLYTLEVDLGNTFDMARNHTEYYRKSRFWPPAPEDLTPRGEALWQAMASGMFGEPLDPVDTATSLPSSVTSGIQSNTLDSYDG